MTCRDAQIQRRAGCAPGARGVRGGRFGQSLSSCGIRTSLCITGAPREAWGCDRREPQAADNGRYGLATYSTEAAA